MILNLFLCVSPYMISIGQSSSLPTFCSVMLLSTLPLLFPKLYVSILELPFFSVCIYMLRFITPHLRLSFGTQKFCFTFLREYIITAYKFLSVNFNIWFLLCSNELIFFLRNFFHFLSSLYVR